MLHVIPLFVAVWVPAAPQIGERPPPKAVAEFDLVIIDVLYPVCFTITPGHPPAVIAFIDNTSATKGGLPQASGSVEVP